MPSPSFSPFDRAAAHPITHDGPATDFFSGALLGNGGLGAVVTTRPDAVVIHFGHNNVWDIRASERNRALVGTFAQVFEQVSKLPKTLRSLNEDEWFRHYTRVCEEDSAKPYPRPFPCGSVLLGFDTREVEVLGHRLEISDGTCRIDLLTPGGRRVLRVFCERASDRLWLRTEDEQGNAAAVPFDRVRLIPDPETPADLPQPAAIPSAGCALAFRQILPAQEPEAYHPTTGHERDRAFKLTVRLNAALEIRPRRHSHFGPTWEWWPADERAETMGPLERAIADSGEPLVACVQLDEGPLAVIGLAEANTSAPTSAAFDSVAGASREAWHAFWGRSGVALDDAFLEGLWYRNLYFLNCSIKPGGTCPGLFANWSYRQIGAAWHGGYAFSHNTQQPFWATFTSNHLDLHLAYVELIEGLMPLGRKWARDYYGLQGVAFAHTAYPSPIAREMSMPPNPGPPWAWEISTTPWAVQSLWWHYLYTRDEEFLKARAFPAVEQAAAFLAAYMRRPEACGAEWADGKYHVFPTVAPELHGLAPGFARNFDCTADLVLTRALFTAYLAACELWATLKTDNSLSTVVDEMLRHFPDYATATLPDGSKVLVAAPGEDPATVHNTPTPGMATFPGTGTAPVPHEVAVNTYRHHRNEGGNDLVMLALQGARLGLLDLERFARQVRYCLLPNGTCANKITQVHGRYFDTMDFDSLARVGIWFENFGLPAVVNECLLQSHDGVLRLFPNCPSHGRAEFRTLRAAGAFLVSALFEAGQVQWVEVVSETESPLKMVDPWSAGEMIERTLRPGEVLHLARP